jgi:hypothetical protein
MRTTDAVVLARLDALITKGEEVLRNPTMSVYDSSPILNSGLYASWRAQSLNALTSLLGAQHSYTQSFAGQVDPIATHDSNVGVGVGILRSVREDAAEGHLFTTMAGLLTAEVFSDFLEMAGHLLENHYVPAAASLTGAVLEDALRRIADSHGLAHSKGDGLASLNDKCAKAGVYNAIQQREVQLWTSVRNAADHGNFGELSESKVQDMQRGVTRFLGEFLK